MSIRVSHKLGTVFAAIASLQLLAVEVGQCLPVAAPAQAPTTSSMEAPPLPTAAETEWWRRAIIYEIYPRSFADTNGDGIGDINGITAKLDYLKDLGVDALWITPCYPSPQVDFGYDISDYCNIAPEFGTLKDFERLVAEAKKRNIRILMDLVLNHTSDKHPWFVASRQDRTNSKRDWYIWRDGKNGQPPNNWQSVFGHSAWKFDKQSKQYYYHFFYAEQPDLNWRNPAVKKAMYDVARFWLDRGVAGFRLDAISTLYEDEKLTNNPVKPGVNNFGDPNMEHKYNDRLPQIHDVLRETRKVLDSYGDNRVLIGETFTESVNGLWKMYGDKLDEIQLPMNFFFAYINKLNPEEFQKQITISDTNPKKGWPVYLFSNHDQPRAYVRYGDGKNNDQIAKMLATILLTVRGTPIMYYGEELGMTNRDPKTRAEVQDPIGKIGWPKEKGRDGERTPMQWSATTSAGFSSNARPWVPVASNYTTHNVQSELSDPDSILNYYKKLISVRRTNPSLIGGEYKPLPQPGTKILAYTRTAGKASVLVAMNMGATAQSLTIKTEDKGAHSRAGVLAASYKAPATVSLAGLTLPPYGSVVLQLQ